MPKPKAGESEKDYIKRCMAYKDMQEYDDKQRSAICLSMYKKKDKAENVQFQVNTPLHNEETISEFEVKKGKFEGKDYLIVPVVLLKEGVFNEVFYPAEELAKFVGSWNGIPVPLYHPESEDDKVSCNDPAILEKTLGRLFNVTYSEKNKALNGEIWLSVEKVKDLAPYLFEMLEKKQAIDVSTGLWGDTIYEEGQYEGKTYSEVLINYRPDHLAILPGKEGACSWKDGCGIRLNISGQFSNEDKDKKDKSIVKNIAFYNLNKEGEKMVTEERKKAVAAIIANKMMPFAESHREWLEGLGDAEFLKINELSEKTKMCPECNPEVKANAEKKKEEEEKKRKENEEKNKPKTEEDFIANAPGEMKSVLEDGLRMYREEKTGLIKEIMANKANKFTEEQLKKKGMEELDAIVALMGVDVNFEGQTGGGTFNSSNKGERKADGTGVPKMERLDFSKK